MGRGSFEGGKGRPIVKYRDTLRSSVQKRLNQSRCHLSYGLDGPRNHVLEMLRDVAIATNFGMQSAITDFLAFCGL